jgi:CBS domain-containing protein
MLCRDIMTPDPKFCCPQDSVTRAAEIMCEEDVGPVPVVRDQNDRKLEGIITDRDVAIKVVAAGRDPRSTCVQDIMSKDVVTCCPDDDYSKALETMARHQVRRIPVLDERGSLVGIISQADVARQSAEHEVGEVVEEISQPAGVGHALGSFVPRGSRPRTGDGFDASRLFAAAACLAGGAVLMYVFDPDRGRKRRARIADKTTNSYREMNKQLRRTL